MNEVVSNLSFGNQTERANIGDNSYDFNIQLVNSDGDSVGIKFGSIIELGITDDLSSFYQQGYIIFSNNLDALESAESISTDVRGMPEKAFQPYRFRGDGRDLICINIKPAVDIDDGDPVSKSKTIGLSNTFTLNGIFSVYDSEDIISDQNKDIKLKKLYFHDQSYQILNSKNVYFSTTKIAAKENGSSADKSQKRLIGNTERSIDTGTAIKELLKLTLEDEQQRISFNSSWDKGKSKIFYSSPANNRAINDLYYLLDYHVSDSDPSNPPALLRKDRTGTWNLIPITALFQTSYYKGNQSLGDLGGPNLTENFIVARPNAGDGPVTTGPERNPQLSINANNLPDYSYAENLEIAGMQADVSNFGIVTHAVHNYDPTTGVFSVDMERNNVDSTLKGFNKNIVQTQRGISGKSPASNITLSQDRSSNQTIIHSFNPNPDQNARINSGSNKIILNSIFNNTTVAFRSRGNTARQAGKFVTLKRQNFQNDSGFDNKVMGTYLVVRVDHMFKNDQYFNYMVCTKPYNAESSGLSNKAV